MKSSSSEMENLNLFRAVTDFNTEFVFEAEKTMKISFVKLNSLLEENKIFVLKSSSVEKKEMQNWIVFRNVGEENQEFELQVWKFHSCSGIQFLRKFKFLLMKNSWWEKQNWSLSEIIIKNFSSKWIKKNEK